MTGLRQRKRGVFPARVAVNRPLCQDHYLLVLELEGFPPSRAGQFVNVQCGRVRGDRITEVDWPEGGRPRLSQPELAGTQPLLRRPFSLAGRRDTPQGGARLELIHRVVGVGTAWLAEAAVGTELTVLGPLGNGFDAPGAEPVAAVVGGGVGIPPLMYLAEALAAAGRQVVAFAGAQTARLLPLTTDEAEPPSQAGWPSLCAAEFARCGAATVVATDDGSLGVAGFVHQPLLRWMDDRKTPPADLAVYACGPEPMLKAVAQGCLARGVRCQLALERHMGCGLGTCQSCIVKVKADTAEGWRYKLACKDGPVFDAEELMWPNPKSEIRNPK